MPSFPSTEWIESATTMVSNDAQFARTSRAFDATIRFDFGSNVYVLTIENGEVETICSDPTFVTWDFAVRAPEETWTKMFLETPPPLYNDLLAVWLQGNLTLEGDLKTAIQHLRPLKRMFTIFGEVAHV